MLLAQLHGLVCGWNYGVEITPQNEPFAGCTVPDLNGQYRTRLRMDPFMPGGMRAEPVGPAPLPVFGKWSSAVVGASTGSRFLPARCGRLLYH